MLVVAIIVLTKFIPAAPPPDRTLTVCAVEIWSDSLMKKFEQIVTDWGNLHNIKTTFVKIPLKDIDMKATDFALTGTGADLEVLPAHKIAIYKDRFMDLTDVAQEIERRFDGFYGTAIDMTSVQGRFYGIPVYAWSHLWVYDKRMLDKHGLKPAETYDEAFTLAKKLKELGEVEYPFGIGLGKDDDAAMFFQALFWANGASVFKEDGRTIAIRSEESKRAIEYVVKLWENKLVPPGAFGWDGASNNKNFLAGSIAFTMNSPTILVQAKEQKPELATNIIHTIYPTGPAGRFSYATGFAFAASRSTKKAQLIKSFLDYFYTRQNYQDLITQGGGSVNPWLKGNENLKIWSDPQLRPSLESLQIEKHIGWPGPVTAAAAEVFDRRIIASIVNNVINNKMSVDDALGVAEVEIRNILEEQNPVAP